MRYRKLANHVIITYLELCEEDFKLLLGLLRGIGFNGCIAEEPINPKGCRYAYLDDYGVWLCQRNDSSIGFCPGADLCPYGFKEDRRRGWSREG